MRAVLVTVSFLIFGTAGASAEWISLDGGPEAPPRVTVTQESSQRTLVEVEIFGYDAETVTIAGTDHVDIGLPGHVQLLEKGLPQLPFVTTSLVVPDQGTPAFRVVKTEMVELATLPVAPSKGAIVRTVDPATVPWEFAPVYAQGGVFPAETVELGEPYIVRDYRGVNVRVYPFRYDASRQVLLALKSISYEVVTEGTGGINVKTRRRLSEGPAFRGLYERQFANFDGAAKYALNGSDGPLLIVCDDAFVGAMQPFIAWKTQRGLDVELITTSEVGGTTAGIKDAIQTRYDSPAGLAFVVLVGDAAQVPPYQGAYEGADDDTRYMRLEGSDVYPDALISRISAQNVDQVQTQVAKFIAYERDPQAGADWYAKATGIASDEGSPSDATRADWLRDDLLGYGFTHVDQIYQGQGGSTQSITDAVQEGRSLINYIGHGSGTSWSSVYYSSTNVHGLTNAAWPWIVDVSCLNGAIGDLGESFAEAWMRAGSPAGPYGAVGMYSSSTSTPWVPPCVMQAEVVDLLVADTSNILGVLVQGGIMQVLDEYGQTGTGLQLVEQYNLFGDCSLQVRTQTPATMTVAHEPVVPLFVPSFGVDTGVPGVTCALYSDGVLHGVGVTDASGHVDIELTEPVSTVGTVTLTCFGYNQLTYQAELPAVVPADVLVEPATVPVGATTPVTVTVTDPDTGAGMADVDVWVTGYGFASAVFTTGASGQVTLDVTPEYGETLVVHGQEQGETYQLFGQGLPVTGAPALSDVAIEAAVASIGLVGSLTPHIEGTVTASARENDLTLFLDGGGLAVTASDPGSTVEVAVTPTELSDVKAALAKTGYEVHTATIPVVEAFGTLAGTVLDPASDPVAGAHVVGREAGAAPDDPPAFELVTDAGGAFAAPDELPVGYYDLRVTKYGFEPREQSLFLAFGANDIQIDLSVAPDGTLGGLVTAEEDGSPLEATVRVVRADTGEEIVEVATDPATGAYTTGPLPWYDYHVTVRAYRRISQTADVTVDQPELVRDFALAATEGDLLLIDDTPREGGPRPAKLYKDRIELAPAYDAPPSRSAQEMALALEDAGYTVTVESSSATVPADWFDYDVVLVSCGSRLNPLGDSLLRSNLRAFAAGGYKLLIEGGEVAYSMNYQDPEFMADVLHLVDWRTDSAGEVAVQEPGHPVMSVPNPITGPIDILYSGYGDSDAVTQAPDAVRTGSWTSRPSDASIVCYDPDTNPAAGQIVFFAFNYGAAAPGERELLLHNAINWLITPEVGNCGLSGTVTLAGEADHSGSTVTLTPGGLQAVTAADGSYAFDGLFPGTYHAVVSHDGFASETADLEIAAGQVLTGIDFELLPMVTIEVCDDPAASIPDNDPAGIDLVLPVADTGSLGGLEVYVDITHPYIADLDVSLISAAGTTVVLHPVGQGGDADDIVGWYPAELTPQGDLDSLLGEEIAGDWTLHVSDNGPWDTGTVNSWCLRLTVASPPTAVGQETPAVLALDGNYPNPFNPQTKIRFAVPNQQRVDLAVYDVRGHRVTTLVADVLPAGRHEVTWTGRDDRGRTVSSGTYFYRLTADGKTLTAKMLLLK